MGSIVGGLYAVGYSAAQLESIVVSVDWDIVFDDRASRRDIAMERKRYESRYNISLPVQEWEISLPAGVVAGQRVGLLLTETTVPAHHITDFTKLQVPFACVAADLERGEAVVLKDGDLADAIRASMAIPTVFAPVMIGDRLLVDGGAVRNLPVQDARGAGGGCRHRDRRLGFLPRARSADRCVDDHEPDDGDGYREGKRRTACPGRSRCPPVDARRLNARLH